MNFQNRYDNIKQQSFELVYNEAHEFILENWAKVDDWSKLGFDYYDHSNEVYLKYGPQRKFPIKQMEDSINKDRTVIKTLTIDFDNKTDMVDSLTINGLKFYVLSEDLIITLASYIEKKL